MLYSIRSERLLVEEIDYNILFRWFAGLNLDDQVWDATTFTKNRDRPLEADVAKRFLAEVVDLARKKDFVSDEHFTVDGTLLEAWAAAKSFQPKEGNHLPPPDDPGNPTVNFRGQRRSNETHESKTDPEALLARKGVGKRIEAELQREPAGREPQWSDRERDGVGGEWDCRARLGAGDAGTGSGRWTDYSGRRQGLRHEGFCSGMPAHERDATRSTEREAAGRQRHRWAHDPARGLRHQPAQAETDRRMFRLAEVDRVAAQGAASRFGKRGLGVRIRLRILQPGVNAKPLVPAAVS
jgi:transposase-like protein DUF772